MSRYTQLPADWAAVSGVTQILIKPTLSTASATGEYTDILGLPLISTLVILVCTLSQRTVH